MRTYALIAAVAAATAFAACSGGSGTPPAAGASHGSDPGTAGLGSGGAGEEADGASRSVDIDGAAPVLADEAGGSGANGDGAGAGLEDCGVDAPMDASLASDAATSDAATSDAATSDAAVSDAAVSDAASSSDASDGGATLGVDCSSDAGGAIGATGAPYLLACTGLYASWSARTIASGIVPYAPGAFLWSDGATKNRYIYLPPGATIDTSNMDEWTFPVGTKIWKEFTLNGAKIETRFLSKTSASSWVWTTYQWSADQTTATELTTGATDVNGTTYEIPDHSQCVTCHQGRIDFVLGFEAIGLSMPAATGLTMSALVASDRLTSPPSAPLVIPGDATASAALGWLHANCGNACHNPSPSSLAGYTGFYMRLSASGLASVQVTNTYETGVNVRAGFTPPDGGTLMRIAPGDPGDSCVIFRDGYRDTHDEGIQMPPIDTHVVDVADVHLVSTWISSL